MGARHGHPIRVLGRRLASAVLVVAIAGLLLLSIGSMVFHVQLLPVLGGSTSPKIPLGALVVDRPVQAGQLRVGDVITFHPSTNPAIVVTHRIYRIVRSHGNRAFVTKGDANGAPDPWIVPASGSGYRYWFSVPHLGFLVVDVKSPVARLALLAVIALLLAGWILGDLWRAAPPDRSVPMVRQV